MPPWHGSVPNCRGSSGRPVRRLADDEPPRTDVRTLTVNTSTASTTGNLSAEDPSLDARARDLIRIGEDGIARENPAAMAAFFAPGFRFHGPDGGTLGREDLWAYFASCRRAFDDFRVTRQTIVS